MPQLAALTELLCTDGMWAVNVRRLAECVCGTCKIKHLAYERVRGSEAGFSMAFRQPLAYQQKSSRSRAGFTRTLVRHPHCNTWQASVQGLHVS